MTTSTPDFDALWDYDDPASTEARFRTLLPRLASGSSAHVQLLTQVARAQGLQRRFEEAHSTLDEAQRLLRESFPRARARYLLERGRVYNSAGMLQEALPLFHEALQVALAAALDYEAVDAAHMMAIAAPLEEQLAWNLEALALAEKAADVRARNWLASLYNNIGWTYHDREDYEQALDYFQKALREREAAGEVRTMRIARWCVARALRSLGRVEEALVIQTDLLDAYEQEGEEPGYVYEELAECNLLLEKEAQARPYFILAYRVLSQDPWLVEREPQRLERLRAMGELNL